MRFFCGLTEDEIADILDLSRSTVKRDWAFAKSFVYRQLSGSLDSPLEDETP